MPTNSRSPFPALGVVHRVAPYRRSAVIFAQGAHCAEVMDLQQGSVKLAPQRIVPSLSQEALAEIVGTTRGRVNFFMNKFRKLGFIDYNGGSRSSPRS